MHSLSGELNYEENVKNEMYNPIPPEAINDPWGLNPRIWINVITTRITILTEDIAVFVLHPLNHMNVRTFKAIVNPYKIKEVKTKTYFID